MNNKNDRYDYESIEKKWRPVWEANNAYRTGDDPDKPDIYILDFFPYPSGAGLSVGHGRNYVPTDVYSRFHRMRGYNVLHPMGWDAFGLPAENYAIEHNIHPKESTRIFTETYKRQMQLLECSYDWSREIDSTDPDYYKWTQYFFLLLHKRGLAYRAVASQWWCPKDQTILANEQVENGRCWRCGTLVTQKELPQWYFKITEYAERLLADLDTIDWPEPIKLMQRNWIGRSEGAEVTFAVEQSDTPITVFTTRPDTLFGVTFMVVAPEHPLVNEVTTAENRDAVSAYTEAAKRKSELDRSIGDQEKSGVFTGGYAIHPLSGERVPVWVADYVMMNVGTGAVMGVPSHDVRDFAFAKQHDLPIIEVVSPDGTPQQEGVCHTDRGVVLNSGRYSGMSSPQAAAQMVADLAVENKAAPAVSYKLRDWLISRQRYWGAPIPIVHCEACGTVPVPEAQLPVVLPHDVDFTPTGNGRSPLSRVEAWVNTTCPQCGGAAQRETDTMDGFACSSWYFLRFASPHEAERPFDPAAVQRWLPVDTYVGGAEHAVMHLLYARFWTKVMYDAGMIDFVEPFTQLRNQGMMLASADGRKMSKSRGNVVTPDEMIEKVGTDALRAYLLFLGPFDQDALWDEAGMRGISRFLDKVWRLVNETMTPKTSGNQPLPVDVPDAAFERERHKLIKRLTAEMSEFRFNTAVAGLMEYTNYLTEQWTQSVYPPQWVEAVETLLKLLSPICPFITEELWQTVLRRKGSIHAESWPTFTPALAQDEQRLIIIQVNGKLRDRLTVDADVDEGWLRETAVSLPAVQKFVGDKPVKKVVVVPNKLVNVVV